MNDQFSFDLVDQPWIPCVRVDDGSLVDLSLREALTRPEQFREINDPSPLVSVSLYRLLIAILHRSLDGPKSAEEWDLLWRNGWDTSVVSGYLDHWKHRFDLFDPERPFFQTKGIEYEYETAISEVVHGLTLGNYSTLFDHHGPDNLALLTSAQAARSLVGYMNFSPGGLISYRSKHSEPRPLFGSADASLLTKSAVMLATGATLQETLTLNLHHYSRSDGEPFDFGDVDDKPAWERDVPATGIDRHPDGYVDLLTWQSRRMRLRPVMLDDGSVVVPYTVRMKGDQLPDRALLAQYETMVPFRKNPRASRNQPAWSELALRVDRALWRDSTVLVQSIEDEHAQPKITRWLASLVEQGYLPRAKRLNADLFGISVDRANVFLWRRERLPLPLAYLEDRELYATLREAMALAEDVGGLFTTRSYEIPRPGKARPDKFSSPMWVFASNLLSPADASSADPAAVRGQIESFAPGRVYWSRLETPFTRFLIDLAESDDPSSYGDDESAVVLEAWAREIRQAAWDAFNETILTLDTSDRELKAIARSEHRLAWLLNRLTGPFIESREEVEA